ncbi:MAG: hypothetical protein KIS74_02925 [Burkholderiales bacterium]|nr:hypothetical protein [Burkholderiales bacterium]
MDDYINCRCVMIPPPPQNHWELVGGPRDGEFIALPPSVASWRIARAPAPTGILPERYPDEPPTAPDLLYGEYRAVSPSDYARRILRWQGWT